MKKFDHEDHKKKVDHLKKFDHKDHKKKVDHLKKFDHKDHKKKVDHLKKFDHKDHKKKVDHLKKFDHKSHKMKVYQKMKVDHKIGGLQHDGGSYLSCSPSPVSEIDSYAVCCGCCHQPPIGLAELMKMTMMAMFAVFMKGMS